MLNSGADDTLRVMTAWPMTLRDDRFAERNPHGGHQSQIVITTCRVIREAVITTCCVIATRCVVILEQFHHKTTNSVRLQRRAIPDMDRCLFQQSSHTFQRPLSQLRNSWEQQAHLMFALQRVVSLCPPCPTDFHRNLNKSQRLSDGRSTHSHSGTTAC